MELSILLGTAIVVFGYTVYRMHKVQHKVLNDWADPNSYCSDEYLNAFTNAFQEKGIDTKGDVYRNQKPRSVVNG